MTAIVLRGDARQLPLPDASVDLIVTSPPYFGLRSYTDGGEHYDGQIGSEATPQAYLEALWACTREWVRVLKPSGSMFINLGDKYAQDEERSRNGLGARATGFTSGPVLGDATVKLGRQRRGDVPRKSLMGLPWRYAIGCTDRLGLILRAEVIWAKPNGLPESVTDRVRRAHEQVFHFTRQPQYYAAVDEIREPASTPATGGQGYPNRSGNGLTHRSFNANAWNNPLGKLPGSVWSIPSAPLQVPARLGVDHFAAFPPALVRPLVLGWSPLGVCTGCGEGRRPVVDKRKLGGWRVGITDVRQRGIGDGIGHGGEMVGAFHHRDIQVTITGHECACGAFGPAGEDGQGMASKGWCGHCGTKRCLRCGRCPNIDCEAYMPCDHPPQPPPTAPAVVLDPFGGTGTTALVASAHGRVGITVDRSADYCRLAAWRVTDPGERARARDMPKPPAVPDGMEPLFPLTW